MPKDIITPEPNWQQNLHRGHFRHFHNKSPKANVFAMGAFSCFLIAFAAWADRRCLYIYQKHNPMNVHLPWESEFKAANKH